MGTSKDPATFWEETATLAPSGPKARQAGSSSHSGKHLPQRELANSTSPAATASGGDHTGVVEDPNSSPISTGLTTTCFCPCMNDSCFPYITFSEKETFC